MIALGVPIGLHFTISAVSQWLAGGSCGSIGIASNRPSSSLPLFTDVSGNDAHSCK